MIHLSPQIANINTFINDNNNDEIVSTIKKIFSQDDTQLIWERFIHNVVSEEEVIECVNKLLKNNTYRKIGILNSYDYNRINCMTPTLWSSYKSLSINLKDYIETNIFRLVDIREFKCDPYVNKNNFVCIRQKYVVGYKTTEYQIMFDIVVETNEIYERPL